VTARTGNALKLEDRQGLFGRIFGVPFLFAGLFALTMFVLSAMRLATHDLEAWWHALFLLLPLLVGAGFMFAGGWMCFGRSGVWIDGDRSEVVDWWGLVVPLSRKVNPFSVFDRVTLEKPERRGGAKTAHWVYPVSMRGPGEVCVEIPMPDAAAAEGLALELSEFLRLPVERAGAGS
jgi:hypothetical protein